MDFVPNGFRSSSPTTPATQSSLSAVVTCVAAHQNRLEFWVVITSMKRRSRRWRSPSSRTCSRPAPMIYCSPPWPRVAATKASANSTADHCCAKLIASGVRDLGLHAWRHTVASWLKKGGSFGLGDRRGPEPLPLRLRDERLHPHVVARFETEVTARMGRSCRRYCRRSHHRSASMQCQPQQST
jgi:hypothetical protein